MSAPNAAQNVERLKLLEKSSSVISVMSLYTLGAPPDVVSGGIKKTSGTHDYNNGAAVA